MVASLNLSDPHNEGPSVIDSVKGWLIGTWASIWVVPIWAFRYPRSR